jgi:hypothetical protein
MRMLSVRLVVCGSALAAIPLGAASFASGMISADICRAYATGSVGKLDGRPSSSCVSTHSGK